MNPQQNPIIIIGMHRSGTSMLTRFIETSGVMMGSQRDQNDEALFFQKINNWALFQAGATWDNPYNLQFMNDYLLNHLSRNITNYINSPFIYKYLGIKKTLQYKTLDNIDFKWGWKDPRNTLLIPLWIKLFPNAKFVHIYRNPIDVAESLRSREHQFEQNFRITKRIKRIERFLNHAQIYYKSSRVHDIYEGVKLWEEYTASALSIDNYTKNILHIKYEDFLCDPNHTLQELSQYLDIAYDKNIADAIVSKIDASRAYAFLNNKELVDVYHHIQGNELIRRLNYSSIL